MLSFGLGRASAAQAQPWTPASLSETWVAHEWCNAFTGSGATNVEGECAEEWDAVAFSRPPTDLVHAKLACDQDPECHAFVFDPAKLVYWKLRDIEPKEFRKGSKYHVYVKAFIAKEITAQVTQEKAAQLAFMYKNLPTAAAKARAAATLAEAGLDLSGNPLPEKEIAAARIAPMKDRGSEENVTEATAPESVTKPAIQFESVFEGEKPKKAPKAKAKAKMANIFGEVEAPKKKFIGLGDDAPSAMLSKGGRSRSRSRSRERKR